MTQTQFGKTGGALVGLALLVVIGHAATAHAQAPATIPPPDEQHAMHPIGVCGGRHFEPRLQICDARDNHVYNIATIGTQTWMAQDLDYGTMVSGAVDQTAPGQKYCLSNVESKCAALHQWWEAMGLDPSYRDRTAGLQGRIRGICPQGWHIPATAEFETLKAFVQHDIGSTNEAPSLMYQSLDDDFKWKTNTDPDRALPHDRYGFAAVATGERVLAGKCPVGTGNATNFCFAHDRSFYWTMDDRTKDGDPRSAVDYSFAEDQPLLNRDDAGFGGNAGSAIHRMKESQKQSGMSVRCIRD